MTAPLEMNKMEKLTNIKNRQYVTIAVLNHRAIKKNVIAFKFTQGLEDYYDIAVEYQSGKMTIPRMVIIEKTFHPMIQFK